jgi:hypothetical protein
LAHRKDTASMTGGSLSQLRTLLDQYISKPTDNPVQEHKLAGMNMSLMIHADGFLAWHQHFLAELENWLVVNGGGKFVPLPYWNPAQPIPSQLDNGNNNVNMPLPANLKPKALKGVTSYKVLNTRILPYHAAVHNAAGGAMPDPNTSPSDPIFWPFHAFLLTVYERWRTL